MPLGSAAGGAVGRAVVELIGDTAKLKKDFDDAKKRVGDDTDDMTQKSKAFSAASAAALAIAGAAVIKFAADSVASFKASESANAKLQNTLANNAKLSDVTAESWSKQAAALQDLTGVSDEAVTEAQALLGTFDLTGQEVQKLIPKVVDLSQKYGIDMTAAAKAVGKATDGSGAVLSRYGIKLDENALKADSFGTVMDALSSKVGGFAEQQGKTMEGRLNIMANNFDDLKETVGEFVVQGLEPMIRVLDNVVEFFNDLPAPVKNTALAIGTVTLAAAALGAMSNAVKSGLSGLGIDLAEMTANSRLARTAVLGLKVAMSALAFAAAIPLIADFANNLMGIEKPAEIAERRVNAFADALDQGKMSVEQMETSVEKQNTRFKEMIEKLQSGQVNLGGMNEKLIEMARANILDADAIKNMAGASSNAKGDVEDLAEAHAKAADEARDQRNAELSLAGGFLGVQGAALSAKDAQREYANAQREVNRLAANGKKGTDEYRDAVRDARDAQLGTVQSQISLASAVAKYIDESASGEVTQRETNRLVREYGRMAGLSKDDIGDLIGSVQGLIGKYRNLPDEKKTKVKIEGVDEAIGYVDGFAAALARVPSTKVVTLDVRGTPGGGPLRMALDPGALYDLGGMSQGLAQGGPGSPNGGVSARPDGVTVNLNLGSVQVSDLREVGDLLVRELTDAVRRREVA